MDGQSPVRSRNDRGHANNVAHFDDLLTRIPLYGTAYNPKNEALQLAAVNLLAQTARTALEEMDAATANYKMAVDSRKTAFDPLSAKVSSSLAALKVSGVSKAVYESAAQIARKIISSGKGTTEPAAPAAAGETPAPRRSTSQMGCDNRAANFATYVTMLESITDYDPNEIPLKTSALRENSDRLFAENQAVSAADAALDSKRRQRDRVLYSQQNNLVETAGLVKDYVKSIFGASSPEYRQITKLTFINYERD